MTFVDNLKEDTDLEVIDEIRNVMMMRCLVENYKIGSNEISTKVSKVGLIIGIPTIYL